MNKTLYPLLIKTGLLLSLISIFGIYYYKNKTKIAELNQELSTTTIGYNSAMITIADLEASAKKQASETIILNNKIKNANQQRNKLENLLARHDLELLAYKKPKLIENRINAGTKKALQEIEEITKIGDINED